jgi:hypothetical protein
MFGEGCIINIIYIYNYIYKYLYVYINYTSFYPKFVHVSIATSTPPLAE